MNYYQFYPNDQRSFNWLLHTHHVEDPPLRVKENYKHLVCRKCRRFDEDAVFKKGFLEDVKLRVKGDMCCTDDNIYCINKRAYEILQTHTMTRGLAVKPIGNTEWYAINITKRLPGASNVYRVSRANCRECDRHSSVVGTFQYLSEIEVPTKGRTWFTLRFDREGYSSRDVFVTEDIVDSLKAGGIKGGYFDRLLNAEEEADFRKSLKRGKPHWPAGYKVYL